MGLETRERTGKGGEWDLWLGEKVLQKLQLRFSGLWQAGTLRLVSRDKQIGGLALPRSGAPGGAF